MRYIPATVVAIMVGAAVMYGLYLTQKPECLFGLIAELIAYIMIPGNKPGDLIPD